MTASRTIPNSLSLSRIVMGLLFVVCFQPRADLFYVAVSACGVALITDVLDGYSARRLQVASIHGRLWDSLGDKAFYAGVVIAFNAQGYLGPLVAWALVVRELALYITRVLFIEKLPEIERIRPWTNWHGYFMYTTILLGLLRMYADVHALHFPIYPYIQFSAYAALVFGIASIVHFLKL
jgi:phosphatidylglycerophosphate synthase